MQWCPQLHLDIIMTAWVSSRISIISQLEYSLFSFFQKLEMINHLNSTEMLMKMPFQFLTPMSHIVNQLHGMTRIHVVRGCLFNQSHYLTMGRIIIRIYIIVGRAWVYQIWNREHWVTMSCIPIQLKMTGIKMSFFSPFLQILVAFIGNEFTQIFVISLRT